MMTNNEEDIDEPSEGEIVDYTEYFEENRRQTEAENEKGKAGQHK